MLAQPSRLPGTFTIATLPAASAFRGMEAWVTDRPAGEGPMVSNGAAWQVQVSGKRIETFQGTTDVSGLFSATFSAPYDALPTISLERMPSTDAGVFLRLTALSTSGFTLIAQRRAVVSVLSIDVLSGILTAASSQGVCVTATG